MRLSSCIFFSLILLQLKFVSGKTSLITILLSGFRSDYLELARKNGVGLKDLKGFKRILKNGVKADYLQPVYPTMAYPTHYSLMTGLYSESHGMIDDWFVEPINGTAFLEDISKKPFWWEGGDPLWITAQRQGKRSALYNWIGCNIEIHGLRPKHCTPWKTYTHPSHNDMKDNIIKAVKQIKNGTDHAGIMVKELDDIGHKYGIDPPKLIEGIRRVDELLILLFKQLKKHKLIKTCDIMVFSDHGMTQIQAFGPNKKMIPIPPMPDGTTGILPGLTRSTFTWPDQAMGIYQVLQEAKNKSGHFDVYLKEDIPEKWHYQNHYVIPPLIIQAHSGWIFQWDNPGDNELYKQLGMNGYAPEDKDMRGIFYAVGPWFKKRFKNGPVNAVDLYQLMCHILDLEPSPHNGTWSNVESMLKMKK